MAKRDKGIKAKRQTPAQQRRGTHVFEVNPVDLDPTVYKVPPARRHRGPSTARTVAGTGRVAAANAK